MEIFLKLTDTDSTSWKFILISDPNSEIPEFWDNFGARKEQKRNKIEYSEIENIDNPCILTLAVNPKEYLELFEDKNLNKKHKGVKKGSSGLGFKNFAQRIGSLVNFDTFEKPPRDTKNVSRLIAVAGEMDKSTYVKNKFSQLDGKRFCFPDGIVSLRFFIQFYKK